MRPRRYIGLAVAVAAISPAVAVGLSGTSGQVQVEKVRSGFDATARLLTDGHGVRVSGPVTCTKAGRMRIDVTITQRASGAVARGTWKGRCLGVSRRWTIRRASALTGRLRSGQVTACAVAAAANDRRATDAVQWCRVLRVTG